MDTFEKIRALLAEQLESLRTVGDVVNFVDSHAQN